MFLRNALLLAALLTSGYAVAGTGVPKAAVGHKKSAKKRPVASKQKKTITQTGPTQLEKYEAELWDKTRTKRPCVCVADGNSEGIPGTLIFGRRDGALRLTCSLKTFHYSGEKAGQQKNTPGCFQFILLD